MRDLKNICVYCGSSNQVPDGYRRSARSMGALIAERGMGVVYGGGSTGLMGEVANGALAGGAHVLGVIPKKLETSELAHRGISEMVVVDTMHQRKQLMCDRSDAAIALPGGFGTLEELFETLTWTQLHFHDLPVGLLNVNGYYDPLVAWLERALADGFVRPVHKDLLVVDTDPVRLLERLATVHIPGLDEWITKI